MSKNIINKAENWAKESLEGYLLTNNSNLIALKEYPNVIIRKDYLTLEESSSRVALISGGGSGHEPAHIGFIGSGCLTAVVCGDLFASPSTEAILAAIRYVGVSNKAGVLLIVKNYTGDRLNFGIAAKKAQLEGINVDWILVDDDVALKKQSDSSVGKRGLCGTLFVHKIAGALAEKRKSLNEIKETITHILNNHRIRTIGISLSGAVQLPGSSISALKDDQIEVGLGIHGEAGRYKTNLLSSNELARLVFDEYLFEDDDLSSAKNICLMINNLGGLSCLETYVLLNDCVKHIKITRPNYQIERLYCGTLMTSLNMKGFSVTILEIDNDDKHATSLLDLLDANTTAPAWPRSFGQNVELFQYTSISDNKPQKSDQKISNEKYVSMHDLTKLNLDNFLRECLQTICLDLIALKDYLNELDASCGDGDCGNSLSKVSENILIIVNNNQIDFDYPHQVLLNCSIAFENGGGTLCILLALYLIASAQAFRKEIMENLSSQNQNQKNLCAKIWLIANENGTNAVQEYGRAKPNQRSIVDPLTSIKDCLAKFANSSEELTLSHMLKELVDVSYESAQLTAKMIPRVGRASYVDPSLIKLPDAGSVVINSIMSSLYKSFLIFSSKNS
jgi:triose/dihydroxyacetone kinase / FAD-AMP lyase (cyclizing)